MVVNTIKPQLLWIKYNLKIHCCFPKASWTTDLFHVQKLACHALQEMRIAHRRNAIQEEADAMEESRHSKRKYSLVTFANGNTRKQLLARSRCPLFKSSEKWTESQKQRTSILFQLYPDIKGAYSLTHSQWMIFNKNTTKNKSRLSRARWYDKVTLRDLKASMSLHQPCMSITMKYSIFSITGLPMHLLNHSMLKSNSSGHNLGE